MKGLFSLVGSSSVSPIVFGLSCQKKKGSVPFVNELYDTLPQLGAASDCTWKLVRSLIVYKGMRVVCQGSTLNPRGKRLNSKVNRERGAPRSTKPLVERIPSAVCDHASVMQLLDSF